MSTHTSAKHNFNKSGREKFERMGWVFHFNPIGRRVTAEKLVGGVPVKSFKMCCLNRLLIQIQSWEATHR
jgi:hypothetical protein